MPRAFLPRPRTCTVLVLLSALSCGRGPAPRGPGALVRLTPRATAPWPATETRSVRHLAVEGPDLPAGWSFVEAPGGVRHETGKRFAGPWYGAEPERGPESTLRIAGSFPPQDFNRLALSLSVMDKVDVAFAFERDGVQVIQTPYVRYDGRGTPQTVFVDVLETIEHDAPFDTLVLRQKRIRQFGTILSIDLLQSPIASLVPPPDDGATPVVIGAESRTAIGLVAGVPVEARAVLPENAHLRFGFGRPRGLCDPDADLDLVVTVRDDSRVVATDEIRLRQGRRAILWQDGKTPRDHPFPAELAGRELTFRFELRTSDGGNAGCVLSSPRLERLGDESPTVVLVTSDTHRSDYLGLAGERGVGVATPFLDELGRRGVYFADCYSSTNITNPSHGAILTGLSVRDTGVINNITTLAPQATTIAEVFQRNGWTTLAAVSAHHLEHDQSGLGQGFDRMSFPPRSESDSAETVQRMRSLMAGTDGLPLFLWLHVFDAHAPYVVPEDYRWLYYDPDRDPYDKSLPALVGEARPSWDPELRDLEFVRSQYKSEVTYLDGILSKFLSEPRLQNAWIGLTADHGESLGAHDLYYTHHGLYPDTLSVPLILVGPGVPAGARVEQGIGQLDLSRTLLDLAGLGGEEFPGRNLLRWVDSDAPSDARFSISSHGSSASVERDGWFLTLRLATGPSGPKHMVQLFHLRADPECEHDLLDQEFERARALRSELIAWLLAAPPQRLSQSLGSPGSDQLAELAALGYADDDGGVGNGAWYEPDPDDPWCRRFEP